MKINELYDKDEDITLNSYLTKCGVKDISEFIEPTGKYLDDCFAYHNMDKAVEMFKRNIGKDTYILCDSGDSDGLTSTTIMYQYMKEIDKDWNIAILIHHGKERGLQDIDLFEHIKCNPRPFLIIPDSGTNDFEQAEQLREFNIDILVLDHHSIDTPIEYGVLINNQDIRNNVSRYGSGCLVTHKFLSALDQSLDCVNTFISANYIDMVALSLVSDIMNMSDEQNRTYYHYGLETIDCIQNKFLKALFLKFIGNKSYTQRDISFKIIPKLNAICRSKNQKLKYILLDAFLGDKTDYSIDEVLDKCAKAHENQISIVDELVENNIDKIQHLSKNNLVLFACDEMPKSYSGLIAGKVMDLSGGKPAIVGKIIDDTFVGSLRSPIPLQGELNDNELVDWARGHQESCGIQIPKDNLQPLVDYYNSLNLSYEPCINVLQSYSIENLPYDLFDLFDPYTDVLWGNGIPKPVFEIHDIIYHPADVKILGTNKRTLKISYKFLDVIIFNATKQNKVDLGLGYINNDGNFIDFKIGEFPKKKILNVIGSVGINRYVSQYGKIYINNQIIVDKFESKVYNMIRKENLFK